MTARTASITAENIVAGDELPMLSIPITRTLIVAGAIASRDYQDVHHDAELAKQRGSKDIFMNILTTNGLVGRYVTDWSGPDSIIEKISIRLGAPNYPDDTMQMTGRVASADSSSGAVTLEITGTNSLGNHVVGTVELTVPTQVQVSGRKADR
ncbi:MAG TPA: MaoC family dehydratase [Acidimicrobiales bacterium]|nr:MaoC family dehydratase [Acidimicrobiales bacterium]